MPNGFRTYLDRRHDQKMAIERMRVSAIRAATAATSSLVDWISRIGAQRSKPTLRAIEVFPRLRGWVSICLELRANAMAHVEVELLQQSMMDANATVPLPALHWLPELLANPVYDLPWITIQEINRIVAYSRLAFGAGYMWGPMMGRPHPVRLYPLPPVAVRPNPDPAGGLLGFLLTTPFGEKPLPMQEVCYLPRLVPGKDMWSTLIEGKSIIEEIVDDIDASGYAAEFLVNYFRHGAMPPTVLEGDKDADPLKDEEKWQQWLMRWLERLQGQNGRVPLERLPPGYTLRQIDNTKGLEAMLHLAEALQETVAAAFQIPLGMLKGGDYNNYATAFVQDFQFRSGTVDPDAQRIYSGQTRFFRGFDSKLVLLRPRPYTMKDPELAMKQEEHELDNGLFTRNEIRARHGQGPVPGGEILTVKVGALLVPVDQIGKEPPVPTQKLILSQDGSTGKGKGKGADITTDNSQDSTDDTAADTDHQAE